MNAITALILSVGMIGAAAMLSAYSPMAVAQTQPAPSSGTDALLTMPLLAGQRLVHPRLRRAGESMYRRWCQCRRRTTRAEVFAVE